MNVRDQFRASHAIGWLIKFMETQRASVLLDREREAIETLIEITEKAAEPAEAAPSSDSAHTLENRHGGGAAYREV